MDLSRQSSIILSITILTTFASNVKSSLPQGLQTLNISSEITTDPNITASFATDFGNLFNRTPGAVFFPSSPNDIATLISFSYTSTTPFHISQRGLGHSTYGQTLVPDGILIDMSSLGRTNHNRINVTNGPIPYADVGAEQIWIDVLNATLKHDLMPRVLTDYLSLTVGGTLSNAGISGRAFMHGPQISNVYELDVITGTGEIVTCSRESNPDLFFAVLGGLGQFGVITRARIPLEPAQKRVRWLELFYTDIKVLTSDEEKLISTGNSLSGIIDYMEGQILLSVTQGSLTGAVAYGSESSDYKILLF
ncbi:Cytokinin dehydrogenase 1 [Rhynchospora pubera]|uniref:cytokinin dehydrogenase n=1 Tax=Rhynchospora pubera TaxID=906938 RepID=A0AAV8ERR5_9POAL|nr:Cytokinin dehydrogenase 1 [Rhynchospora pubera]